MAVAEETVEQPTKWVGKLIKSAGKGEIALASAPLPLRPVIQKLKSAHGSFAEAYSTGTEFCLLTKDNEAIHSFTYCKDFISDIYWGAKFNKPVSIYRFSYDPTKLKPSSSPAKLLIRDKKLDKLPKRAINCQALLNLFERSLGMEQYSICYALEDHKCVYIESPCPDWVGCLPMVSLWTLIARVGFNTYDHEAETADAPLLHILKNMLEQDSMKTSAARDAGRIKTVIEFLGKMEKGKYKETFEPYGYKSFKDSSVSAVHNSSGIIATIGKCGGKMTY